VDLSTELVDLGSKAAAGLIVAMTTDGWHVFCGWFSRLLGHGEQATEEHHLRRMSRDSEQLAALPLGERPHLAAALEADWRVRFRDLLEEHPELASELQALIARVAAAAPPTQTVKISQNVTAGHRSTVKVAGHDIIEHK
jgi:hypothetical protein